VRVPLKLCLIGSLLASGSCCFAQDGKLTAAEAQIEKRIVDSHADVGVALRTLDGKDEWLYHADDSFQAASTMKIPVMIELFRQVKEKKLSLDDKLRVYNIFISAADGSMYKLDPADDSESSLYKDEGEERTLRQLCELMITRSSNLATNLLIQKLGVQNIRAMVHALGADGMNVVRGVEDGKALQQGINNTATARCLEILLTAIAEGKAVDANASRQMVEILERQKFNEGIPAGVPAATRVAHKTGEITKIHHDAAIVYAPRPFVLVILVRGLAEEKESSAVIVDITKVLYQAIQ
jgi:beta-lactamase class A